MLPEIVKNPARSLFGRSGRDPFSEFQNAINRVFREFNDDTLTAVAPWSETMASFTPRLDMEETDSEIVMTAELPGLSEKDVQIELDKDVLTVRGEKKEDRQSKNGGRYVCERSFGAFERTIRLPTEVEKDKISAKLADGVLRLTLPKSAEAKSQVKKIPIKH